jgi:hypothetical protein
MEITKPEPNVVWQLVDQHGAVGARAIMDEKGNLHLEVVSGIFETVKIVRGEPVDRLEQPRGFT